jgi:hypothetical protein
MAERPPTLQKHLCHITQTQFVAQSPNHDKEDDICGIFEKVERSTGTFIKKMFASQAAEYPISKDGFLPLLFCGRG